MKKLLVVLLVLAVGAWSCGGGSGGGAAPAGGDAPEPSAGAGGATGTELGQADAETTSKAISMIALEVLQQLGGGAAPAGKVMAKSALMDLKDSSSFSATIGGSGGGTCSVTSTGTSDYNSEPMTFNVEGTLSCDNYSTNINGIGDVSLNGALTLLMNGTIAQDYSSILVDYTLDWTNIDVTIAGTTYTTVAGNYALNIGGAVGNLTFTESGVVGGQTINTSYTFESAVDEGELEEEPDVTDGSADPVDEGTTENDNLDQTITTTTYIYAVYANDGAFLGVINYNRYDSNSLCNKYGTYGSKYSSSSIWNKYGSYGSDYSTKSAFSDYTSSPPIIYEYDGYSFTPLFYLTTNTIKTPRIDSYALLYTLQYYGCNIER